MCPRCKRCNFSAASDAGEMPFLETAFDDAVNLLSGLYTRYPQGLRRDRPIALRGKRRIFIQSDAMWEEFRGLKCLVLPLQDRNGLSWTSERENSPEYLPLCAPTPTDCGRGTCCRRQLSAIVFLGSCRTNCQGVGRVDAAMVKHEWPQLSEFRDHAVAGIVLPHTPAHDVLEEKIVQDAQRTGLSNLSVPRRTSIFPAFSRRASRAIQVQPKQPTEASDLRAANVATKRRHRPRSLVVVIERFKCWIIARKKWCTPANILAAASFTDSMYVLLSAPLRLGFFFDPWQNAPQHDAWQPELVMFTTMDVAGSFLRVWNSRAHLSIGVRLILKRKVSQSELAPQEEEDENDEEQQGKFTSTRSIRSTTSSAKRTLPDGWISWLILLAYCIPWELLALIALRGQHANILHVFGVLRLLTAHNRIGSQLAAAIGGIPQKLASGTVANVMVLFFYGVYFCHVAASGYMLVAHWECGLEFTRCERTPNSSGCWVLRDRLEKGSRFRQYVRTLYWACKTVVTLGQGDLIPVTLVETSYRIVVQFFAGLWVTAILTAYTFFFTHKDANLTSNISTRLDQAVHFLLARKAPTQLVASVDMYFQYMQRTRNGVEEELIMAALPPHYRSQCSHYVRYKAIAPLAIFRRRKGAFLRTVMGALVRDVYAPGQTLLQRGETDEMFIVACGEVRLIDTRGACAGRIMPGNAYAEYALFERHLARHHVEAATFCEVWYLPSKSFKAALAKHFSKLVYASLLLQQLGTKTLASHIDSALTPDDDTRVDSVTSMKDQARQSKVLGHGSLLLQAVEARKLRSAAAAIAAATPAPNADRILSGSVAQLIMSKVPQWRMSTSRFRRRWALAECIFLLYLLGEVPYHLAFQRGFGLLNGVAGPGGDGTTPRSFQITSFLVSLSVEMFFYVDLILRVFYFVRPYPGAEMNDDFLGTSTRIGEHDAALGSSLDAPSPALATRSSQIFQLYLEHESLMLEFFALAPAALIWDILPKELFSRRNVHVFRCLRLLRLLRVRKLRGKLRGVLTERGYGPAFRLLSDVVIFCTATSHAAACIFFAVADRTSFEGGLPVKGVAPQSLSFATCLEDASRFDNCTWYMYDRSTFDMDAPYLRSMLWSIVLLSTVGFGDIVAFSTRECIVDALWIFFSANICYITSCALSSVLAQINVLTTIRHDRLESINVLLMSPSMASVSDATKRTVRSYYEAKWKLNGSAVGDLEVLEHLPRSLRRAVSSQLYAPDLRRCVLFVEDCGLRAANSNGDAALFMQQLALIITCEHFLRNVTVIKEGHLANEFFVILSGEVECLLSPVPLEPSAGPTKHFSATRMARKTMHHAATAAMKRTRDSARIARNFTASTLQNGLLKEGSALMPYIRSRFQPIEEEVYSVQSRSSITSSRSLILSTRSSITASHQTMNPILLQASSERLPKLLRYGSLKLVMGAMRDPTLADAAPVPISVLKQHDYFGEESLSDIAKVYEVSIRVVSSARVAVVRRRDFLALAARFPHYVARLRARKAALRDKTRSLVAAHRANFQGESNKKILRVLGTCASLYVDSSKSKLEKRGARVLDPTKSFARWWHRGIGFILVYNFYVIVFRLAFLPYPNATTVGILTGIDYTLDVLLFADVCLKYGHLGFIEFGEVVLDPEAIKSRYRASGLLWQDCLGMLPIYYHGDTFVMATARLPRLLRCLQLGELLQEVHTEIQERFLRGNAVLLSVFDLVKFFLIFVSTAHYIASLYYLLGWTQLETGLATTSWISVDLVLRQNPDSPMVHYMRSMYWCLSSFTVDCFGDILARNFLESCYELFTCVLGWVFIGQVIGRINALMITLDKAQKHRNDRVEDFQQYAKQRALPNRLRQRAMKGLAAQAQCQLELNLHSTLRDLPGVLRALVAVEMYSALLQPLPEFAALSLAQLEVVARALVLEIYLPGDIICEANRVGTRLYILKHGCAERVAPRTGIVFGALTDGALFGEFSFFLPGARRLFLVRAVRSCQVLQLHRRVWDRLWPPAIREQVEHTVLDVVTRTYRQTAWGFLNIAKNFYIKNDTPVPSLGSKRRSTVLRRMFPVLKMSKPRESIRRASKNALATRASGSGANSLLPAAFRAPVTSFRRRVSGSDMSGASEKVDILGSYQSIIESCRSTRETLDGIPSSSTPPVALPPNFVPTEEFLPCMPLVRLSASTELRWKRHEKRLRAIQLFHVAWGHVQGDLRSLREVEGATGRVARRRVSITVPPSYNEVRAAQLEAGGKKDRVLGSKRRHSIQSDPIDLRSKFTLSASEVRVLEQRMTTPPTDAKTRTYPTMLAQTVASRSRTAQASQLWSRRWQNTGKVTPFAATVKAAEGQLALRSSPYSIWASPSTRAARFEQNARFRDVWTSFMLAVTLYYLIFLPLQIGFLDSVLNETDNQVLVITWFVGEYLVADAACVVDFVLHRNYFVYQTSSGEAVTDPERIARHYWQHGWYVVDVVSMLPLELVMFAGVVGLRQAGHAPPPVTTSEWPLLFSPTGGLVNWHTFVLLRINRFLRIVHLRPLSDQLQRFLLYDRHLRRLTPSICYLIRLAVDFLLGTHWLSCLFYGVSYLAYDDGEQSWLTTPDMLAFGDGVRNLADIRMVPLAQSYLRTYHFSIGAITTVCYGDILPMNAQETQVTMAVIFISVGIFSMLSGGFYKYFDMELGRRAEYEEKVAQVGHFLRFHRFPGDTWRQMQVYFALSWRESRGRRERELLRGLPPSVRQDLAQHVHASLLKNVALFTRCDPTFARAIIAALQHEFFVRNDVIIQRGDMERSLYIVESGIVLISAVRKRHAHSDGDGDGTAGAEDEDQDEGSGNEDNNSSVISVNEWVKVSVRASLRMRKSRKVSPDPRQPKPRQKSLVALMSPTGTVSDINNQTEREEKIYKGPFDYFGERSLLFGTPRNATCMALCVTSLFVLTSARFEAILDEFPHERSNSVSAWVMTRTPAKVSTEDD